MKVLMGPVNIAGQPIKLVKELKRRGINADLLQYGEHSFGYKADKIVDISDGDRATTQIETIKDVIAEDYDIYHFWLRSLFFGGVYERFTGMDLPFLKSRGAKIVYRFTGQDLRYQSVQREKNPYNVYQYGYESEIDEDLQRSYIDFIEHYVDQFVVQDREMKSYREDASIIRRSMDIDDWEYVGVQEDTDKPLVIHAPSNPELKGTWFVQDAVQSLREEGFEFEYEEIKDLPHKEAVEKYKQADIIVDQLLLGWHGVFALEGMALGKPVVCYIRDDLRSDDIPLAEANPDTITDVLRELLRNPKKRVRLGREGRKYVEEVHDVDIVVDNLVELYEDIMKEEHIMNRKPQKTDDIDYFLRQYQQHKSETIKELKKEVQESRYKARKFEEFKEEIQELRYKVRQYESDDN
jgi:glycosyltransferase involved in cell wall biosynthesis